MAPTTPAPPRTPVLRAIGSGRVSGADIDIGGILRTQLRPLGQVAVAVQDVGEDVPVHLVVQAPRGIERHRPRYVVVQALSRAVPTEAMPLPDHRWPDVALALV